MNAKIKHVVLEPQLKGASRLRKWVLLLGSIAAFLFGLFSLIVAFISFILTGDFSTLVSVGSVVIQFIIPVVIGVASIILGKVLLNKALGLKEWERATPILIKTLFSYYEKNKLTFWLALVFVVLLIAYFLKSR